MNTGKNRSGNRWIGVCEAAVQAVAGEAWPTNTEIRITSVPEFALSFGGNRYVERSQVEELSQSALDAANAAVTLTKEILSGANPTVTTEVPLDRDAEAETILERAKEWNADLLVLGSHGRRARPQGDGERFGVAGNGSAPARSK